LYSSCARSQPPPRHILACVSSSRCSPMCNHILCMHWTGRKSCTYCSHLAFLMPVLIVRLGSLIFLGKMCRERTHRLGWNTRKCVSRKLETERVSSKPRPNAIRPRLAQHDPAHPVILAATAMSQKCSDRLVLDPES